MLSTWAKAKEHTTVDSLGGQVAMLAFLTMNRFSLSKTVGSRLFRQYVKIGTGFFAIPPRGADASVAEGAVNLAAV